MARLPWKKLDDEAFEDLCAEFLRHMGGEVERPNGEPRDGDVALRAMMPVGKPPLDHKETWWIQCKGWNKRSINDRALTLATRNALNSGECDAYIVMTTGKLTQSAKEWVQAHNDAHRFPFKIFYFDGDLLSDLLITSYDFPLANYFGASLERDQPDPETMHAYVGAAASLWSDGRRDDVIASELQENLASFRAKYPGKFGPQFDVAYESQSHEIHYLGNGWISTKYRLTLVNLSEKRLRFDSLTIRPHEPISIEDMQLITTDHTEPSPQPLDHRVVAETAQLKVVEVVIPHGLTPRGRFSYEATFRLRCQALEGDQSFDMPTWALTRSIAFLVSIPGSFKVEHAKLLRDYQEAVDHISVEQKTQGKSHVLTGKIWFPNIHEIPQISFHVAP